MQGGEGHELVDCSDIYKLLSVPCENGNQAKVAYMVLLLVGS